jgi:hypothetical protein
MPHKNWHSSNDAEDFTNETYGGFVGFIVPGIPKLERGEIKLHHRNS